MLSFTTVSLDLPTPGRYLAAYCDGRWLSVIFGIPEWIVGRAPMRVIDAWFAMAASQPAPYEAAVLYANTQGTDTQNDYIWGHGHVSAGSGARRGELVQLDLGPSRLLRRKIR